MSLYFAFIPFSFSVFFCHSRCLGCLIVTSLLTLKHKRKWLTEKEGSNLWHLAAWLCWIDSSCLHCAVRGASQLSIPTIRLHLGKTRWRSQGTPLHPQRRWSHWVPGGRLHWAKQVSPNTASQAGAAPRRAVRRQGCTSDTWARWDPLPRVRIGSTQRTCSPVSGHGGEGLMVGRDYLSGLFQPHRLCDCVTLRPPVTSC